MKKILSSILIVSSICSMGIADEISEDGKYSMEIFDPVSHDSDSFVALTIPVESSNGGFSIFGGNRNLIMDGIGTYLGLQYFSTSESDNITKEGDIFNVGLTLDFIENITLLGGMGWIYNDYNREYTKSENYNLGIMYNLTDKLGVTVGYDTAPSVINCGFSMYF